MKTYEVDIGDKTYEVDAPDEATAWKWANATHGKAKPLDLQGMQRQALSREQLRQQIESDPISRGAREAAQENVVGDLLGGGPVAQSVGRFIGGHPAATTASRIASSLPVSAALGASAIPRGVAQLAGNIAGLGDSENNPFSNQRTAQIEQMRQQGGVGGSGLAKFAGEVLSPVGLAAAKSFTPAATWYGRAAQGSGIGGAYGAAAPVETEGNYWGDKITQANVGSAVGAAIPLSLDAGAALGRGGRHIYRGAIEPFFQRGRDAAEGRDYVAVARDRAREFADALRNPQSAVAGYKPTAGEVIAALPKSTTQGGQAEFVGQQANVSRTAGSTVDAVNDQQKTALVNELRGITSREGFDNPVMPAIRAAELEREAVTAPMRDTALANANLAGVKVPQLQGRLARQNDALVSALQDTGKFQSFGAQSANRAAQGKPGFISNADRAVEAQSAATDTAGILANRKAQTDLTQFQLDSLAAHGQFPLEANRVVGAIDAMLARPGDRAVTLNQQILGKVREKIASLANKDGVIDARDLYAIRKTDIGDVVASLTKDMDAATRNRAGSLVNSIKNDIDNAIESAGGTGWKEYLATYKDKAKNIEQMQIGQALENKLAGPATSGSQMSPSAYSNALTDPSMNVNRLKPQNLEATKNVEAVLANRGQAEELAKYGKEKASKLTGTPEIQLPNLLNQKVAIGKALLRTVMGKGTERMDEEMARDMLTNPQRVSQLMAEALRRADSMEKRVQLIRKYSPLLTQGIATEGVQ